MFIGGSEIDLRFLKITVDALVEVSIIRPTSGADGNEKALRFNELQGFIE